MCYVFIFLETDPPIFRGTNKDLDSNLESALSSPSLSSLFNSVNGSATKDDYAEGGGEAPADGTLDFFVSKNKRQIRT